MKAKKLEKQMFYQIIVILLSVIQSIDIYNSCVERFRAVLKMIFDFQPFSETEN